MEFNEESCYPIIYYSDLTKFYKLIYYTNQFIDYNMTMTKTHMVMILNVNDSGNYTIEGLDIGRK